MSTLLLPKKWNVILLGNDDEEAWDSLGRARWVHVLRLLSRQVHAAASPPWTQTALGWVTVLVIWLDVTADTHSRRPFFYLSIGSPLPGAYIEFLTGFEAALLHNSLRLLIMWWRPVQNTLVHTADVYFLTFQFFKSISNKARHHVLNIHKQNCLDYRISYTAWRIMTSCLATVCIPSHRSKTHFSVHVPW